MVTALLCVTLALLIALLAVMYRIAVRLEKFLNDDGWVE